MCCMSVPEDYLILANSADPDEMQRYATFHLRLHCLPKFMFRGFQYTKGQQPIKYPVCRNKSMCTC